LFVVRRDSVDEAGSEPRELAPEPHEVGDHRLIVPETTSLRRPPPKPVTASYGASPRSVDPNAAWPSGHLSDEQLGVSVSRADPEQRVVARPWSDSDGRQGCTHRLPGNRGGPELLPSTAGQSRQGGNQFSRVPRSRR
jgi:hypothetical protein